jgi:hypothetical protein
LGVSKMFRSVEIQSDRGCLLNRLTIEPGRLELIAHNRLKRGVFEDGLTTDEFRIGWFAIFAHRHLHNHRAGYATRFSNGRVNQRASPEHLQGLKLRLLNRRRRRCG